MLTPGPWMPTGTSPWDPPWYPPLQLPPDTCLPYTRGLSSIPYSRSTLSQMITAAAWCHVGSLSGLSPQSPATLHAHSNRMGTSHFGPQVFFHSAIHSLRNPLSSPYRVVAFCIRPCHGLGCGRIGRDRGMPRGSSRQRWGQRGLQGIGAWTTSRSTSIGSRLNGRSMFVCAFVCLCDRAAKRGLCRTLPLPHPCMLYVRKHVSNAARYTTSSSP